MLLERHPPGMTRGDWKQQPVYMMDFEGSPASGVVEYGVVRLMDGRIDSTQTGLCRPSGRIPDRDREVHGIGDAEVRDSVPFSEHYRRFVNFRREGIFAAHNRHAENTFLKQTWAVPPAVPGWESRGSRINSWGPWIDTLSVYRTLYPGMESYGLGELVNRFECREDLAKLSLEHCPAGRCRPHCALYDALASALLLLRLEEEEGLRDRITPGWLLRLSGARAAQQELF